MQFPRTTSRPAAPLLATCRLLTLALLLASCGVAGAQVLLDPAVSTSHELAPNHPPGDELAFTEETSDAGSETAESEATPAPAPTTVTAILDGMLIGLGETGYFGECPTVESTGLDPLSSTTPQALADMTERHHCSWVVAEHDAGMTLNLDRLDVLGDEAVYYVALVHNTATGDWRVADSSERNSLSSPQVSPTAVYIDDLLPSA